MKKLMTAVTVIGLVFGLALPASAANWTRPAGDPGDWSLDDNWDTGVPDGVGAFISNGGTAEITAATVGPPAITGLQVGRGAGNVGTVTHTAGRLTSTAQNVHVGGGGTGIYNLSGTGELDVAERELFVSEGGTFNQSDDSTLTIASGWFKVWGTYNLSGGTITRGGGDFLALGTFNQTAGTITGGSVYVSGLYNMSGGQLVSSVALSVTGDGATFNHSGGSVSFNDWADVQGDATYNLSGTGHFVGQYGLSLGQWEPGGTFSITGARASLQTRTFKAASDASTLALTAYGDSLTPIEVAGGVTLAGCMLDVQFLINPALDDVIPVIVKEAAGAISGQFTDPRSANLLGEGQAFAVTGAGGDVLLEISYMADVDLDGRNNDLTLKVLSLPVAPVAEPAGLGLFGLALLTLRRSKRTC